MSDIENAAPAGDSGSSSMPEILSISAAASMMEQAEERHEEEDRQQAPQTDEADHNTSEQTEPAGDEGQGEQTAGEPEKNTPDEPEPFDWDKVPGDAKFRTRDGEVFTGAELKKSEAERRELARTRQEFEAERQQFQAWAAQQAQTAQYLEQIAPQAIAAIQAQLPEIPPMPDRSLRDTDPFTYSAMVDDRNRAIEDYNEKVGQIQAIEQAREQSERQRNEEQSENQKAFLKQQRELLHQKVPELRDPKAAAAFEADLFKYGTETYGFDPSELGKTYDHRLILMSMDAFKYRKLVETPPKPVQQQRPPGSVPVAQPGRRMPEPEARATRRQEIVQRANKAGGLSLRDAASLMSAYEKD